MDAAAMVRMARRRAGLSQRELARRSGVTQATISRIESGKMSPTFDSLSALVEACGMQLQIQDRHGLGVDRSQLDERLRATPQERLRAAVASALAVRALTAKARPAA